MPPKCMLAGNMESFNYITLPNGTQRKKSTSLFKKSDCLGDEMILTGRTASFGLTTLANVTMLSISRHDYLRMVGSHMFDLQNFMAQFLHSKVKCLSATTKAHVRELVTLMHVER